MVVSLFKRAVRRPAAAPRASLAVAGEGELGARARPPRIPAQGPRRCGPGGRTQETRRTMVTLEPAEKSGRAAVVGLLAVQGDEQRVQGVDAVAAGLARAYGGLNGRWRGRPAARGVVAGSTIGAPLDDRLAQPSCRGGHADIRVIGNSQVSPAAWSARAGRPENLHGSPAISDDAVQLDSRLLHELLDAAFALPDPGRGVAASRRRPRAPWWTARTFRSARAAVARAPTAACQEPEGSQWGTGSGAVEGRPGRSGGRRAARPQAAR